MKKVKALAILMGVTLCLGGCGEKNTSSPASPSSESKTSQQTASENSSSTESKKEEAPSEKWKPEHDITIRIPAAAGGAFDVFARIFAQGTQEAFGQTVMVTNLAGANGGVAASDLNNYDPSACEMMGGNIGMFTIVPLFKPDMALSLDDYDIVTSLVSEEYVLCVAPDKTGIKSWEDLQDYAKNNKILVGTKAPGETDHALITATFGKAGFDYNIITSDGANKLLLSTVAGDTTCSVCPTSVAEQYVEEGTALPILCFSAEPCKEFKGMEVPTAKSKGYDYVFRTNNFIMTRKGADPAALKQIYTAYTEWQETDEFKKIAQDANFKPFTQDGETTKKMIQETAKMFKDIYDQYYAKQANK